MTFQETLAEAGCNLESSTVLFGILKKLFASISIFFKSIRK